MPNIQSKLIYRCPIKISYQDQDKKCHLASPKCPYILSFFVAHIELTYFEFPNQSRKFFAFKKLEISGPKCTPESIEYGEMTHPIFLCYAAASSIWVFHFHSILLCLSCVNVMEVSF